MSKQMAKRIFIVSLIIALATIACTSNNWSAPLPDNQEKVCDPLADPENAKIYAEWQKTREVLYGVKIEDAVEIHICFDQLEFTEMPQSDQ